MNTEKLQKMQFLEQNLQGILMQKQAFHMELSESDAALKELEKSGEEVFKMIGQLMIKTSKETIIEELEKKKKLLETRLEALEKQEESLSGQAEELREELINSQKKE